MNKLGRWAATAWDWITIAAMRLNEALRLPDVDENEDHERDLEEWVFQPREYRSNCFED
jgi:hypothetical protein